MRHEVKDTILFPEATNTWEETSPMIKISEH